MESHKASRYGALTERKARERYNLTNEQSAWFDGRRPNGKPVEIKAAVLERRTGRPGRFRIFREPHNKLARQQGHYVFVVYRPHGRGVSVEDMKMVEAARLRPKWSNSGHKTAGRSEQHKIDIATIFR